ncbi:hypothetical protein [Pseudoalteromonas denitrificans]|uniref:DUF3325 domain-containing protein n=1 Tax=Pseudoalteromonas denitrificans DSM 6059 TaxID=1123010 RepID=A0A1I1KJH4_9GAMM|nr:hypothetical protein [Pseudoalteromonas denitrificans]SFC60947.1 hypothetical protein SAMN02745724_02087 [Pseudoalteromonas denitrificans DSM 6059]
MFIYSALLWVGSLLVFISSPNQKLIEKRVSKKIAWPVCIILMLSSWYFLSEQYAAISAALVVLTAVMAFWTLIVLAHGHLKMTLYPFALSGLLISITLAQLGGV